MEIVQMQDCHIEQIAQLEKVCFSDPWSISSIRYELTNPLSYWFVALEGETVAGYIGSQAVLDEADMMNVAVAPSFRRQGVGCRLIHRLMDELCNQNVKSLTLEVRQSNEPAIQLYEKLGFRVSGRRIHYYRNPKEDALIMRKEW